MDKSIGKVKQTGDLEHSPGKGGKFEKSAKGNVVNGVHCGQHNKEYH